MVFLLAISLTNAKANNKKEVKSEINQVTVFLRGAQIEREAKVYLKAGKNEIVFQELSPNIDANTIQAKGEGNFTILSINHQLNYLKQNKKSKRVIVLEDSLDLLQNKIDKQIAMQTVYQEEESMLVANKSIGGNDNGVNILDLQKATDFYRSRLTDIKTKLLDIKQTLKKLNEEKSKVNSQLAVERNKKSGPSGEIIVTVSAKSTTNATLTLNYAVTNAGWIPYYDLRAKDVNSPIELNYKANVYQNTGVDWENVDLTLSTGDPSKGGTKPDLDPWYVSLYEPNNYRRAGGRMKKSAEAPKPMAYEYKDDYGVKEKAESVADYTQVVTRQTNLEYQIGIPTTVKADGKKSSVHIKDHNLNAEYKYYCVPKLEKDAFLVANVAGWSEYNLLAGNINLFFEGTYVGKSYLDVEYAVDTIPISLGRDKGIVVKREKIKDYDSRNMIGLNQKEAYGYEITALNNKRAKISLVIEDQLPVSTDKDIQIDPVELSNAKHRKNTGELVWEFDLKPRENKKLILKYTIKYPKNKNLQK